MPLQDFTKAAAAESTRLIDFESIDIVPGFVNDTFFLTVKGAKPCLNMEVRLLPRIYIQCPDYWAIEVVGCLPSGVCLEAVEEYSVTIPLAGVTGSNGIEVIGASGSDQRDVAGGNCHAGGSFVRRSSEQ